MRKGEVKHPVSCKGEGDCSGSAISPQPGMMLSDEVCRAALAARDARFDGLFFIGVKTTGIYCRAVCSARSPKRENYAIYPTAAAAEAAGFRPCLKCRPELAPGIPVAYEMRRIADQAADIIRENLGEAGIAVIANQLGVSERQLRRVFEEAYGVTPALYRNTCRLLLAKNLLTDTDMAITAVAYACGFSSVRRFNDAFVGHYRMSPTRFRKRIDSGANVSCGPVSLRIGYRPPYRFDLLLEFLRFRAIEGVESVGEGAYLRTVRVDTPTGSAVGWIKVEDMPLKNCLSLTVSPELFSELPSVVAKVRRLFDVDCLPHVIELGLSDFYKKVPERHHIVGIRLPCSFDGFEMAVRAILGQQITVKAANTLAGRVAAAFGDPIELSQSSLTTSFPKPEKFCAEGAADRLGELGVIRQRSRAICALAQAVCEGDIKLSPGVDIEANARALLGVPGIGDWTVQYLLMRAYNYPDAFPSTDCAIASTFPNMKPREIERLSAPWSPWRSYAVMSLWSAVHEP